MGAHHPKGFSPTLSVPYKPKLLRDRMALTHICKLYIMTPAQTLNIMFNGNLGIWFLWECSGEALGGLWGEGAGGPGGSKGCWEGIITKGHHLRPECNSLFVFVYIVFLRVDAKSAIWRRLGISNSEAGSAQQPRFLFSTART